MLDDHDGIVMHHWYYPTDAWVDNDISIQNVLLIVLNTMMYDTLLYSKYTSNGLSLENWLIFWLHFLLSIRWLLLLICFIVYKQCNTQQCSFAQLWTGFHCYSNGKHSTINQIRHLPITIIFTAVNTWYLLINGFYLKMYVYSLLFCNSCQIFATNTLSWLAVQWWAFIFLLTYCLISQYDKLWPSRDSEESKKE